jgi:hypothetical protein
MELLQRGDTSDVCLILIKVFILICILAKCIQGYYNSLNMIFINDFYSIFDENAQMSGPLMITQNHFSFFIVSSFFSKRGLIGCLFWRGCLLVFWRRHVSLSFQRTNLVWVWAIPNFSMLTKTWFEQSSLKPLVIVTVITNFFLQT